MTDHRFTILVVEDDAALRTFLADNLTADGFAVLTAETLRDALRIAGTKFPDLVLLDLGLPDGDGLDLITAVRHADGVATHIDPGLPLLALTGRSGELDRVRGFEKGVDDYLCKPFNYGELRGRVRALLWRADRRERGGRMRVGAIEIDPTSRVVTLHRRPVELSRKEFTLLLALAREPTRVWRKDELLRAVWGFRGNHSTRTLDSHACRLRHKLEAAGDRFVVNVWGVGYRLVDGEVLQTRERQFDALAGRAGAGPAADEAAIERLVAHELAGDPEFDVDPERAEALA